MQNDFKEVNSWSCGSSDRLYILVSTDQVLSFKSNLLLSTQSIKLSWLIYRCVMKGFVDVTSFLTIEADITDFKVIFNFFST